MAEATEIEVRKYYDLLIGETEIVGLSMDEKHYRLNWETDLDFSQVSLYARRFPEVTLGNSNIENYLDGIKHPSIRTVEALVIIGSDWSEFDLSNSDQLTSFQNKMSRPKFIRTLRFDIRGTDWWYGMIFENPDLTKRENGSPEIVLATDLLPRFTPTLSDLIIKTHVQSTLLRDRVNPTLLAEKLNFLTTPSSE